MKKIKYTIVTILVLMCSHVGFAQNSLSSYFLDGTFHNYRLNPAMKAERGFLSLGIGNLSLKTKGNVGISNFLYPREDNKLATFMSGSVTADEFLGKMPDAVRFGLDLDESLLAFGFRMFGGYTTFGVTMHSSTSISLPKGFFEFAKKGLKEETYSFSGLNINTMNYLAATLGYSHEIFSGFRIGVNAKYLAGLAHADIFVDKLNVELSEQRWMIESHATAQAALFCEARATVDEEGVINNVELGELAPSASGFAIDLGAVYDMSSFVPGLTLSASVVDLGYIKWKHMMHGQSTDAKVEFTGFNELDYNDPEASVQDELKRLGEDASKMIEFNYEGSSAVKTSLNTTMYLGAEYNMPFYKPLSVAVLYGQCFSPFESKRWYDVRGFVNISPVKWLEATVNYSYNSYGTSLGWMLNLHPAMFSLFIGCDHMIINVTPQYIPVNDMNAHFVIGINCPLGKRK